MDADHPLRQVAFQRLDVDDVEVTRVDGSKTMVAGTFHARLTGTNFAVSGPTKHGADVPPGTYDVSVSYKHPVDGHDGSYSTTIELR